ncbi:MAG TPA: adenylate/guanylate cyclase domain-containing protein [Anaerolineaceae bacterium]|jgi:adenylate cyclase
MTSPKLSAYAACQAAMEMYATLCALNQHCSASNEPPLFSGIGIITRVITAGGLGASDRLHYTIIGDTVNPTQRLESLRWQVLETSGVIVSDSTYLALGGYREQF